MKVQVLQIVREDAKYIHRQALYRYFHFFHRSYKVVLRVPVSLCIVLQFCYWSQDCTWTDQSYI